jgi:hypothetical protein
MPSYPFRTYTRYMYEGKSVISLPLYTYMYTASVILPLCLMTLSLRSENLYLNGVVYIFLANSRASISFPTVTHKYDGRGERLLTACLAHFPTSKMEAVRLIETSANLYHTSRGSHPIRQHTLHSHCRWKLKYQFYINFSILYTTKIWIWNLVIGQKNKYLTLYYKCYI